MPGVSKSGQDENLFEPSTTAPVPNLYLQNFWVSISTVEVITSRLRDVPGVDTVTADAGRSMVGLLCMCARLSSAARVKVDMAERERN